MITSESIQAVQQGALLDSVESTEKEVKAGSSNGRVMLIDGSSIIYRAYYKLLGMLFIQRITRVAPTDPIQTFFS